MDLITQEILKYNNLLINKAIGAQCLNFRLIVNKNNNKIVIMYKL